MRNFSLFRSTCLIGAMAAAANAQNTYKVDFQGDRALTADNNEGQAGTPGWHWGWDNLETPIDDRSEDATFGTSAPGTGGSLRLLDDDDQGFRSSHLHYYMGEDPAGSTPQFKAGATVVARVKNNGTGGAGVGFGYSTSDGNHTGVLGISDAGVSITGWQGGVFEYDTNGGAAGNSTAVPGGTVGQYRTYAFTTTHDGPTAGPGQAGTRYDVWVLNNPALSWSNNAADWTQLITNLHRTGSSGNMPDANGTSSGQPNNQSSGVLLGSFGPGFGGFGRTADGDLEFDWLNVEVNTPFNYGDNGPNFMQGIVPWNLDYSGIPNVPEPASLSLMALGGFGLMRRRKSA